MKNAQLRCWCATAWLAFAAFSSTRAAGFDDDLAVYDRLLATQEKGARVLRFGDVGVRPAQLRAWREQLLAQRDGRGRKLETDAVTPGGSAFKWTAGKIPFRFDPAQVTNGTITAAKMRQFRDSVREWEAWAGVQFLESTSAQANYVTVRQNNSLGGGYSSAVGMAGGEQFLEFGPNAWNRGTICHEAGHALGLWHEMQRTDRDSYVTINFSNIAPADQPNFTIVPGSTAQGSYDFLSVMHYRRNALALDPKVDTITPLPAYAQFADLMGNVFDRTLSTLDRAGLGAVYGAPSPLPSAVITNTRDSGPGSLRSALYFSVDRAMALSPLPTVLVFNIPASDPGFAGGVFTIQPTSLLTAPGAGTTLDGATQTSFSGNTNPAGPEVVLDGSLMKNDGLVSAAGFVLRESGCALRNLVIRGFNLAGVLLYGSSATGNVVAGNYLGTDAAGTSAAGNGFLDPVNHIFYPGVSLYGGAHDNLIGGATAAARNLISGNAGGGIAVSGFGTEHNNVQGNFIGTDASGSASLGNGFADVPNNYRYSGVAVYDGAKNNLIGPGNLLSGNAAEGVIVAGPGTSSNLVQGNFIGTNSTGQAALGNGYAGVSLFDGAQLNLVGGSSPTQRNLISGNGGDGLAFFDGATSNNAVQGNYIGTDATGQGSLGNHFSGVGIFGGAHGNQIGGRAGARNVISGNLNSGIIILGAGSDGNVVQGNTIGFDATGTVSLGNAFSGVGIYQGASGNLIGGSTAGASNLIAGNQGDGVTIGDLNPVRNTVSGNSIFANAFNGIGLFGGGNNLQAAPVLSAATASPPGNPDGCDLAGSLTSAAGTSYRLEFFASASGSQGRTFLGTINRTTDGSGQLVFNVSLATALSPGVVATATATDPLGNTSSFSAPLAVAGGDVDGDGLPDGYMLAHFGHAAGLASDRSRAQDDFDGDGESNGREFRAGTDPKNPVSRLAFTAVLRDGNDVVLAFRSVAGRTYRLDLREDFLGAPWSLFEDQLIGTGGDILLTDFGAVLQPRGFYRVEPAP